jgi:hypothetical protein
MPDLYAEDELDHFAEIDDPLLPLGYPVEGEETEFHPSTELAEPEEMEEDE